MEARSVLMGLGAAEGDDLLGSPEVCVAVLDGPVDLSHPCFEGADLTRVDTLVEEPAGSGPMSLHGTHVASLIFGCPEGEPRGLAPRCRGLILPVFRDADEARVPQMDLARAIERAMTEGAHIINISGGERARDGQAEDLLERALRRCDDNGVLVVAAAGNDGCDCLQVPAAVPGVLAVGATGAGGSPLQISNWGAAYATHGVVAPGEAVVGATPGGGRAAATGSSFATPLVAGVAALLVSAQVRAGRPADPKVAGQALLAGATPSSCSPSHAPECRRFLAGSLNAPRAYCLISRTGDRAMTDTDATALPVPPMPSEPPGQAIPQPQTAAGGSGDFAGPEMGGLPSEATTGETAAAATPTAGAHTAGNAVDPAAPPPPAAQPAGIRAACETRTFPGTGPAATPPANTADPWPSGIRASCACGGSDPAACHCQGNDNGTHRPLIYAIGTLGFDFQTEARRDSFRQQMNSHVTHVYEKDDDHGHDVESPGNPYDPHQLAAYLAENPWASDKLTWTLNLDATPVYALEAEMPVGMDWSEPIDTTVDAEHLTKDVKALVKSLAHPPVSVIYRKFREALLGQVLKSTSPHYVSRVSIPGVLTGRTVRLFNGMRVPVVEVKSRGVYAWDEKRLVDAIIEGIGKATREQHLTALPNDEVRQHIEAFLDKVYYQFRNLGQDPADRALNYAATNGLLLGTTLKDGMLSTGVTSPPVKADGTTEPPRLGSLDTITVTKSPYCRPGSLCYDVRVVFFDPENDQRAKTVFLFTHDVSDEMPVSLAPVHRFLDR
ncbi:S8 family serine peptidase [Streptomyces sp. NPDC091217]|uniref:cyanobactin maturation protease PatG family protein n=1 Tax=Streptomyces sp. NPDC091217 TaxID=3365975 RepID=UPI0037FD1987